MGSRFASVVFSFRIGKQNFNSYLSRKLSRNTVVIHWQLVHHSLFKSNHLWKKSADD